MRLEKVTSRSSEAALAGWISSNDATLFTVVLVMVIAVFLHARLNQGARENAAARHDRQSLTTQLQAATDQLGATQTELAATSLQLELTQAERDRAQQQLTEKLDRIAELMARLNAVRAEKGQLESERQALAAESTTLQSTNASLRERLDTISRQLTDKLAALEGLQQERDRLKAQADELEAIVARLEKANVELVGTRDSALASRGALERRINELESQVASSGGRADEYLAQLQRSAALLEKLTAEKEHLQDALTAAEAQRQAELAAEARNNRELVGLAGRLERVAILFDASGSMRQAAVAGDGDRWAEAQQIAGTWLKYLNVQECVLIVFAIDVQSFPADGTLADLRGPRGDAVRQTLLERVKAVQPAGWTNTLAALRKAYEYDVDTILLLSDGAPSMVDTGVFDPALARQIYDLCRQHPNVPINTLGLGNYFDKDASTFLRTVAHLTGGTFRGM